jgi:arylsulfatase A-like enzyme
LSRKGATAYREHNNVPFIPYHPDTPGGKKCRAVTSHLDLVPTILSMTGADKKQKKKVIDGLHGHDVSPLLEDPQSVNEIFINAERDIGDDQDVEYFDRNRSDNAIGYCITEKIDDYKSPFKNACY